MFILTHCDVYYITRLLFQYSDAGTFYYKHSHKVIIIHVCGFYRFYINYYLEGFLIINYSTFNSIESYIHIYDLYSFLFIIHKGLGVTFYHAPPFFFILTTFVNLTIFTCIVLHEYYKWTCIHSPLVCTYLYTMISHGLITFTPLIMKYECFNKTYIQYFVIYIYMGKCMYIFYYIIQYQFAVP